MNALSINVLHLYMSDDVFRHHSKPTIQSDDFGSVLTDSIFIDTWHPDSYF